MRVSKTESQGRPRTVRLDRTLGSEPFWVRQVATVGHRMTGRWIRTRLVPALALVAVLVACTGTATGPTASGDGPSGGAAPPASAPTAATHGSATGSTPVDGGTLTITVGDGAAITTDPSVDVAITAPPTATAVQVSTDPTFSGAPWSSLGASASGPATRIVKLTIPDAGYQMVFARVRADPSAAPSRPVVAAIDVDTTYGAATSSAEDGVRHQISWAGLVAPNVLQVHIEAGRVVRQGRPEGLAVVGRALDTGPLDNAGDYRLGGQVPTSVSRISVPVGRTDPDGQGRSPMVHDLFLTFAAPITLRTALPLHIPGDVADDTIDIDPSSSFSPAIHVNQIGYAPGDDGKIAHLSAWTGAGGGVRHDELAFQVVDVATGTSVEEGRTTLHRPPPDGEMGKGDLTGAEVHIADFSAVHATGRYRICVDTIGCSTPVTIAPATTWQRGAVAVARAMFQQRSGIALTEPYTAITHPAAFTTAGGTVFHQTDLTMLDNPADVGHDDRFDEYAKHVVGDVTVDASGGHFDAGDWNSRIQHLAYLAVVLDLVRLYPSTFADLDLNIPESGDGVPDIVDEGLWDLDHFARLQTPDGGIPGNIDQARFSTGDETSWHNSIDVYVFAPDVWSTYTYASTAARAATVLQTYDATRAARYATSATNAMAWAEQHWAEFGSGRTALESTVEPQRAAAAAAMLGLTRDPSWNSVFAEATTFDDAAMDALDCPGPICDSAWIYASIDPALTTATTRANAVESIVRNADKVLAGQQSTAYGWAMDFPGSPLVYGLGPSVPHGIGLLRAYVLTGDIRYRTAAVQSAAFALGDNPTDTSFATGLGINPVRHPLIVDAARGALPVWQGTFVYGIDDLGFDQSDDWVDKYFLTPAGLTPAATDVPLLHSFYDVGPFPMMNEFTVHQSHAVALWTLGVLAATS